MDKDFIIWYLCLCAAVMPAFYGGMATAKDCKGSQLGYSQNGDHCDNYQKNYQDCDTVEGNLELTYVHKDCDLKFLSSIKVVTGYVLIYAVNVPLHLNNLQLIRGHKLLTKNSLSVLGNHHTNFIELQFSSLTEILAGNVMIEENENLCYIDSLNWTNIFNDPAKQSVNATDNADKTKCGICDESCNSYCWGRGPDMCQKLNKINCHSMCRGQRCSNDPKICCNKECAAGCSGPTANDCFACLNFNNSGECVNSCPRKLGNKLGTQVYNPHGKFSQGLECVKQCDKHMWVDDNMCLSQCPAGKSPDVDGNCTVCDGPCPTTCEAKYTHITKDNIANFIGCERVFGQITITRVSFQGDDAINISNLSVFESVKEISDYLMVQSIPSNVSSLSFFANLEIIAGQITHTYKSISLLIHNTGITSLGLKNLMSIKKGNAYIKSNKILCYVKKDMFQNIWSNLTAQHLMIGNNKPYNTCVSEGHVCSDQCSHEGCWESGDDECLFCAHFSYNGTCLPTCNHTLGLFHAGDGKCQRCHVECADGCNGTNSYDCFGNCQNFKNRSNCVSKCPDGTYADDDAECQGCHNHCKSCSGPGLGLNSETGCHQCKYKGVGGADYDGNQTCTNATECGQGYYVTEVKHSGKTSQICVVCDPVCQSCTGAGSYRPICTCKHLENPNKECVNNCTSGHFPMGSRCNSCDSACRECRGPSSSDCTVCKSYKVFTDLSNTTFNCTESCPPSVPAYLIDAETLEYVCTEDKDKVLLSTEREATGNLPLIIGIVAAVMIVLTVIVCSVSCKIRNKKAIFNFSEGVEEDIELTPLSPTEARPDMAKLRFINETQLQRGAEVGSGAFGTVYQGFWIPETGNVKIPIAIKVLNEETTQSQSQELLDEARVMASVDNKYCVSVLGVCMASQLMMITPFMPLGCLLDYVRTNTHKIGSKVFLEWSRQIAMGMVYLEERGIVHMDLAARNVLVNTPSTVRVTDFGMSKLLDVNQAEYQFKAGKMPIKWLALESLQHKIFTHKTDIWSYGVTIWEIFTYGAKPYGNYSAMEIPKLLESGERLQQPEICTIDVYMLMIKCWMIDAASRPNFKELAREFAKMAQDPGRYLVIKGDRLMRLPSQSDDDREALYKSMCLTWNGQEKLVEADEYLRPECFTKENQKNEQKSNNLKQTNNSVRYVENKLFNKTFVKSQNKANGRSFVKPSPLDLSNLQRNAGCNSFCGEQSEKDVDNYSVTPRYVHDNHFKFPPVHDQQQPVDGKEYTSVDGANVYCNQNQFSRSVSHEEEEATGDRQPLVRQFSVTSEEYMRSDSILLNEDHFFNQDPFVVAENTIKKRPQTTLVHGSGMHSFTLPKNPFVVVDTTMNKRPQTTFVHGSGMNSLTLPKNPFVVADTTINKRPQTTFVHGSGMNSLTLPKNCNPGYLEMEKQFLKAAASRVDEDDYLCPSQQSTLVRQQKPPTESDTLVLDGRRPQTYYDFLGKQNTLKMKNDESDTIRNAQSWMISDQEENLADYELQKSLENLPILVPKPLEVLYCNRIGSEEESTV